MATKTFEELKQLAIQIRDEKANKANTATRIGTQMIEHLNKLEQEYYNKDGVAEQLKTRDDELARLDKMTTEYNVSVLHPTSGSGGSNKYTLETAIAQVPSKYRTIGIKCSFVDEAGQGECWEYSGSSWVVSNFIQIGGIKLTESENKNEATLVKKFLASNNLYDEYLDIKNSYLDSKGKVISGGSSSVTTFIPFNGVGIYCNININANCAIYDKNFKPIKIVQSLPILYSEGYEWARLTVPGTTKVPLVISNKPFDNVYFKHFSLPEIKSIYERVDLLQNPIKKVSFSFIGYIHSGNGALISQPGNKCTDFIPFFKSAIITSYLVYDNPIIASIAFYDIDKTFISSKSNTGGVSLAVNIEDIPVNTRYVRFTTKDTDMFLPYVFILMGDISSLSEKIISNEKEIIKLQEQIKDISNDSENNIVSIGKNIVDPATILIDILPNERGELKTGSNWDTFGLIKVEPNTEYCDSERKGVGYRYITEYSEEKEFIKRTQLFNESNFITSELTKYIYYTVWKGRDKQVQIEKGSTPTNYEPYSKVINLPLGDVPKSQLYGQTNDLSFPSKQYVLKGKENAFYYKSILKYYNPYIFYLRFDTNFTNGKCRALYKGGTKEITLSLYNENFEVIKSITSNFIESQSSDKSINVLLIGDSYNAPSAILEKVKELIPNAEFVGGLYAYTRPEIYHQAVPGWALFHHSTLFRCTFGLHSLLCQPTNIDNRYLGDIKTWEYTIIKGGQGTANRNIDLLGISVESNYYPTKNLQTGDLVFVPNSVDGSWNSSNGGIFKKWNGSNWEEYETITSDSDMSIEWGIDISKFLSVYQIETPDVLIVWSGINDYAGRKNTEADLKYSQYKDYMDKIINSAKEASSSIKIGVCTSTSAFPDYEDDKSGLFNAFRNFTMWDLRNRLINDYDKEEKVVENVFLVDTAVALDDKFAWFTDDKKPFEEYLSDYEYDIDNELIGRSHVRREYRDSTHPAHGGYPQLGVKLAGFIAYLQTL